MCRQNSCAPSSVEEAIAAEENLLIYCKPVELYNILHHRARYHPSFLRRCLRYKLQARRRKRLRAGVVIFNYRDHSNILQKTEVTEGFSCPFCMMHCASFKGLRYHLCSSHDLFNFDFWATEEYKAVNVTVKIDTLRSETVADGVDPRLQTFFFCSKPRRRGLKTSVPKETNIKFLELEQANLAGEDIFKCIVKYNDGEKSIGSFINEKSMHNGRPEAELYSQTEHVASSFSVPNISIANSQSSAEPEAVRSLPGGDSVAALTLSSTKTRKLSADRSDPRNRMLLQKRQFYHSHRVQPMELQQVLSDRDSEDEVDDEIADLEDRRMLDDFVDVTKDEKELMHLWNSFVRKQRVLADGHVPWACEAFSKLHGQTLVVSPALFWCWRLFMIKLWSHGLLDATTMNNCNMILEKHRNEGSGAS